jgi:hypothetical protein
MQTGNRFSGGYLPKKHKTAKYYEIDTIIGKDNV